jgi:hypothetical protein
MGLKFWHVTLKFRRTSVVAGLETGNMNLTCGWDFSCAGNLGCGTLQWCVDSSEWDLSLGAGDGTMSTGT